MSCEDQKSSQLQSALVVGNSGQTGVSPTGAAEWPNHTEPNVTNPFAATCTSSSTLGGRPATFSLSNPNESVRSGLAKTTCNEEKQALTAPPPTLLDGSQFSWVYESGDTFPQKTPSEPLSELVQQYFPKARICVKGRTIFTGVQEAGQIRIRANGGRAILQELNIQAANGALTLTAIKQAEKIAGKSLVEVALNNIRTGLHALDKEVRAKLNGKLIDKCPAHLYRVEFNRNYGPYSSLVIEEIKRLFPQAVAQLFGFLYNNNSWSNGNCLHVYVQPRHEKSRRFKRNEKTTIKGYQKEKIESTFRVEVTYFHPLPSNPIGTPEDLGDEVLILAADAEKYLNLLHPFLSGFKKAVCITEQDLAKALKLYGIRRAMLDLSWLELTRQVCELGVYDPAIIQTEKRVRRETMRKKVAHPIWGIFEKRQHGKGTGAGGIPYYVLREDWKSAVEKYEAPKMKKEK